jgi:hypothetical protein
MGQLLRWTDSGFKCLTASIWISTSDLVSDCEGHSILVAQWSLHPPEDQTYRFESRHGNFLKHPFVRKSGQN